MRKYQLEGLNWLIHLYDNGINGILADEMVGPPPKQRRPPSMHDLSSLIPDPISAKPKMVSKAAPSKDSTSCAGMKNLALTETVSI